jgi:hypothetical protein
MLTVESRHNVFFRYALDKVLNPAVFNTSLSDILVYNWALTFVVPGSCLVEVKAPILSRLTAAELTVVLFTNRTKGLEQLDFI